MAGVDGVVLYIGGGEASHSAELMRMSNFFHFRGQEGWLTASSGSCNELPTAGAGIRVSPGPFLVNSRFPGGAMQAYMGRILTAVDVETTNVPPGSPRSDFVVMNIEDPYPSDGTFWPFPGTEGSDSRRNGPYAKVRVIPDVPTNTLSIDDLPTNRPERGWTCIPIARIDRPANTGTITQSMIKNLRSVINPWAGIQLPQEILDRLDDIEDAISDLGEGTDPGSTDPGTQPQKFPVPAVFTVGGVSVASTASNTLYPTDTDWKYWPAEVQGPAIIPPWANYCAINAQVITAMVKTASSNAGVDANVIFQWRMKIGDYYSYPSTNIFVEPNDVYYNACPDKRANRPPMFVNGFLSGQVVLPKEYQGKKVYCGLQARRISGDGSRLYNGLISCVQGVTTGGNIYQWKETPQ